MLQNAIIGKGNCGVGRDEPESSYPASDCAFDNVGVGETASFWDRCDVDIPELGEFFAMLCVFEFAVTGQGGSEAGFARAHRVALAGDGEGRGAGPSDVARDEREVVDCRDGDGSLGRVIDAHGPADE